MKPLYHTTAEPEETTLGAMGRGLVRLNQWQERLRPHFARPEPSQHARLSLQAILSDIPRTHGWQIAEHARLPQPSGMQRLLSRATWDQEGVRDELRSLVSQTWIPASRLPQGPQTETPFAVLVSE